MLRILNTAFLICLMAGATPAIAQAPAAGSARLTPPTRDFKTPGYVKAKELPDGTNPPANADGNFILGSNAPAPRRRCTAQQGRAEGNGLRVHHEFGGQQDLSRHRTGANTFGTPDPDRPRQTGGDHQPSRSLHAPGGGLCPETIRSRHRRAVHRRRGRTRPGIVHGAWTT